MARGAAARGARRRRSALGHRASIRRPTCASDAQAAEHIARERAVFAARRRSLDEQVTLLHDQVAQAQAQAAALESQIQATSLSAKLSDEELAMNKKLVAERLHQPRPAASGLQRVTADYASRIAEHRSDLASARQRAGELRTRIAQLRLQHQTQATDELRDATAQVRELDRTPAPVAGSCRAPDRARTGRWHGDGAARRGAGSVVAPREPLLDVVPAHEKLVIERAHRAAGHRTRAHRRRCRGATARQRCTTAPAAAGARGVRLTRPHERSASGAHLVRRDGRGRARRAGAAAGRTSCNPGCRPRCT